MKILIIEDHQMFRAFLRHSLEAAGHRVVGEAPDFEAGLRLSEDLKPELVVLDLNLPDGDGLELARRLIGMQHRLRILVLSARCDDFTLSSIVNSGVDGFVDKNEQPPEVLLHAIEAISKGGVYFTEAVMRVRRRLLQDPEAFRKIFSDRELEIFCLIGSGLSDEEVAERMGFALATAKWHRRRILDRLQLHSTRDLMRYALARGLTRVDLIRDHESPPMA